MSEDQNNSRRDFLALTAAVVSQGAAPLAAQDARKDASATGPGPENKLVQQANPNTFTPPITDHGEVQTFWSTFSAAHRRIQEGGWSRQITVEDFPISKEIAGVNMRLTAGGIRELHWHNAAEWALMLDGKARLTAMDKDGKAYVRDVAKNDLWFFPTGIPHSIQGLAPDGCEFLLVFDDGKFSEGNTTLISDWLRHTPPEVLAKNWGVPESDLGGIYKVPQDGRYIFQTPVPGSLEEERRLAAGGNDLTSSKFDFSLGTMQPTFKTASGEVRVIDSRNFKVADTIAAAHVTLKPGGLRELHWHQNADEWQYYVSGEGRMTVFFNGAKARTADFRSGDVGYVPKTFGHYIENTGSTDLVFLEMFRAAKFEDLSLSDWVTHTPPKLIMEHLNISEATLRKIPKSKQAVVPA